MAERPHEMMLGEGSPQICGETRKRGTAMSNQNSLDKTINEIIRARKEKLPKINAALDGTRQELNHLMNVQSALRAVLSACNDPSAKDSAQNALDQTIQHSSALSARVDALETLKRSFSRNTINIAVSGAARSGKSTTLQRMSGLTDDQIPSGSTKPLTAVTSRLYNSDDTVAKIKFRDTRTFVTDYLIPHLSTLNSFLGADAAIRIESIDGFKHVVLPGQLEGDPSVAVKDSLARLKDAQASFDFVLPKLTGKTERVPLSELKQYVAYPTNEEENAEEHGGKPLERLYLAVDDVKIFCPFPTLGKARIGLVDLPGLGEVSDTVARIHTKSLQNDVDQVFLIAKPSHESGYVDKNISEVIDQLSEIQPGIDHRNDLITIGINVKEGNEQSARSLGDDIRRKINQPLAEKYRFAVREYSAVDNESVSNELHFLLQHIAKTQRYIDKKNLAHALNARAIADLRSQTLEMANDCRLKLQHALPDPLERRYRTVQTVAGSIIDALEALEQRFRDNELEESDTHQRYMECVQSIEEHVRGCIQENLFVQNRSWEETARGESIDLFTFYRGETRRIRREIVAEYGALDGLYEENIEQFKRTILRAVLNSAGIGDQFADVAHRPCANSQIDAVDADLESKLHDAPLHEALQLLRSLQFQFYNTVFLSIADNLDNLKNPPSMMADPQSCSNKKIDKAEYFNSGSIEERLDRVRKVLTNDAMAANNRIAEALKTHRDGFGQTLEFYVSRFNDCLYRRDVDYFKQVTVQGIINGYDVALPGKTRAEEEANTLKAKALFELDSAIERCSHAS